MCVPLSDHFTTQDANRVAIQKQEFYEGAALRRLVIYSPSITLAFSPPFYIANQRLALYIKYSTKARTPWGFSFSAAEYTRLLQQANTTPVVIGCVCGGDGVATISLDELTELQASTTGGLYVSFKRPHRSHYVVSGPSGTLAHSVAPSDWQNLLVRMID
jgi:hypothetical protein